MPPPRFLFHTVQTKKKSLNLKAETPQLRPNCQSSMESGVGGWDQNQNIFNERIVTSSTLSKTITVSIFSELERRTLDMLLGFDGLDCTAGWAGHAKSFENSSTRSDSLKGCKKKTHVVEVTHCLVLIYLSKNYISST